MSYEGMDPAEQRQNAKQMQDHTAAAHSAVNKVMGNAASTTMLGPWADQFLSDMQNIFAPQMRGVVNAMNDNAAVLLRRAQMQEDASSS
jgi:hypothetical protein